VDINPAQIPWPLTGMRVFTKDSSKEISPAAQANGFFRINRIAGIDFYRIKGAFTDVKHEGPRVRPMFLNVALHAHKLSIGYFHPGDKETKIDIMDCQGRTLRTFVDPDRSEGIHHMDLMSAIDGVAILKVRMGDAVIIKKVLMY
jgi:hypothetical protein